MVIVVVVDSSIVFGSFGFDPVDSRFLKLQLVLEQAAVQGAVLSLQILKQLIEAAVFTSIVEQCRFPLY